MLKNYINEALKACLRFAPTVSQEVLIDTISNYILDNHSSEVFILKGYAGTGKTTFIDALVKTLQKFEYKSVLLAPTGRAAKVLSKYTGQSAYTIHKRIYRQRTASDAFGRFELGFNELKDAFFIVDEASMISDHGVDQGVFGSGSLLDDLLSFVDSGSNCKLIVVGDSAQLPPVKLDISPALDGAYYLSTFHSTKEYELIDVLRQSEGSGILFNATMLRKSISEGRIEFPKFNDTFDDFEFVNGEELIEKIEQSYSSVGSDETIVICRSNKRANLYNGGIRSRIFCYEEQLVRGDFLMVVKNNYHFSSENKKFDFIANGDIAELIRIHSYQEEYGHRFADVTIRLIDYDEELDVKIMMDTLLLEGPSLGQNEYKALFTAIEEDYTDIKNKRKRYLKMREDPYLNALQVKYAYAVTCHKAQGGQWKNVFVDQGYFIDSMLNVDYLRWLYTAITRASENVFLVNFNDEFKMQ